MREIAVSVQYRNAQVFMLAALGALPFGWRAVVSVGLGGGIQIVNLRGLERSVTGMLRLAAQGQQRGFQALLALRLVLLLGLVGAVLLTTPVEPIAFVVGLSTAVPAAIWYGLASAPRSV